MSDFTFVETVLLSLCAMLMGELRPLIPPRYDPATYLFAAISFAQDTFDQLYFHPRLAAAASFVRDTLEHLPALPHVNILQVDPALLARYNPSPRINTAISYVRNVLDSLPVLPTIGQPLHLDELTVYDRLFLPSTFGPCTRTWVDHALRTPKDASLVVAVDKDACLRDVLGREDLDSLGSFSATAASLSSTTSISSTANLFSTTDLSLPTSSTTATPIVPVSVSLTFKSTSSHPMDIPHAPPFLVLAVSVSFAVVVLASSLLGSYWRKSSTKRAQTNAIHGRAVFEDYPFYRIEHVHGGDRLVLDLPELEKRICFSAGALPLPTLPLYDIFGPGAASASLSPSDITSSKRTSSGLPGTQGNSFRTSSNTSRVTLVNSVNRSLSVSSKPETLSQTSATMRNETRRFSAPPSMLGSDLSGATLRRGTTLSTGIQPSPERCAKNESERSAHAIRTTESTQKVDSLCVDPASVHALTGVDSNGHKRRSTLAAASGVVPDKLVARILPQPREGIGRKPPLTIIHVEDVPPPETPIVNAVVLTMSSPLTNSRLAPSTRLTGASSAIGSDSDIKFSANGSSKVPLELPAVPFEGERPGEVEPNPSDESITVKIDRWCEMLACTSSSSMGDISKSDIQETSSSKMIQSAPLHSSLSYGSGQSAVVSREGVFSPSPSRRTRSKNHGILTSSPALCHSTSTSTSDLRLANAPASDAERFSPLTSPVLRKNPWAFPHVRVPAPLRGKFQGWSPSNPARTAQARALEAEAVAREPLSLTMRTRAPQAPLRALNLKMHPWAFPHVYVPESLRDEFPPTWAPAPSVSPSPSSSSPAARTLTPALDVP